MLGLKTSVWLGLQSINKGTIFEWSDDSAMDYTNWNIDEPRMTENDRELILVSSSSLQRTCGELVHDSYSMGKWEDTACNQNRAFICQKLPNPVLTEPSEDPFQCNNNITGWHMLGSSCYGIYENESQKMTWNEAQAKCRTYDSNLVTFKSSAVIDFLKRRFKSHDSFFWIGLRETKKFNFQPVIPHKSVYTNWLAQQPQRVSEKDNCVAMNSGGSWMVRNCKEKLPFTCEWNSEEEEETTPKTEEKSYCPSGLTSWIDVKGENCYYFSFSLETWNNAMVQCYKIGGHLASFHSLKEMHLVRDYLSPLMDTYAYASSLHIGLGKRRDGSYAWVDHSPVDFTFWEEGEPRDSDKDCVQMNGRTGKWKPTHCNDNNRYYICSSAKVNPQKGDSLGEELDSAADSTSNDSDKRFGYEPGQSTASIIGSVIGCLIILLMFGGAFYYFYLRKPIVIEPTLLVPERI